MKNCMIPYLFRCKSKSNNILPFKKNIFYNFSMNNNSWAVTWNLSQQTRVRIGPFAHWQKHITFQHGTVFRLSRFTGNSYRYDVYTIRCALLRRIQRYQKVILANTIICNLLLLDHQHFGCNSSKHYLLLQRSCFIESGQSKDAIFSHLN